MYKPIKNFDFLETKQSFSFFLFVSTIWLSLSQLCTIPEGTASITQINDYVLSIFNMKVAGSFVTRLSL